MNKTVYTFLLSLLTLSIFAQGPYAPPVGEVGSTAIHKDSSIFKDWATAVMIQRGRQDIAAPNSDTASVGSWSDALGQPDGLSVVSLGDSGIATLSFTSALYNGPGPDFAIFENAFSNTFLELAFVEVSSNGTDFYRFPSYSLTNQTRPVGSFGSVHAREIHNLAGKYRANYGTPFDLEDLALETGLDVQNITHIRIIDVIGTLDSTYAQKDSEGRKINDIYPTPYASGGFDLDAVGAIHIRPVGITEHNAAAKLLDLYPNPTQVRLNIVGKEWVNQNYAITSLNGQIVASGILQQQELDVSELSSGIYFLQIQTNTSVGQSKFIIR